MSKAKVVGLASTLFAMGGGVIISQVADIWGWVVGLCLIGLGIVGFLIAIFWKKFRYLVDAKYRRWRKLPSGTIISKTEKVLGDGNGPITKITKEVKKL